MPDNKASLPFYLGDWCVIPEQYQLQNSHETKHLQPKLMEVLLYLSEHVQQVVSTDELIQACWSGQPMTDNPIHKTIAQLRKALGDSSGASKYIKTVPRKGYMLIGKVSKDKRIDSRSQPFWQDQSPFMGEMAFQQHHKEIFYGRDQPIADFLKIIERINHSDSMMIIVSGISGVGKTSFIQAGILPKLLNPYKPFNHNFNGCTQWHGSESDNSIKIIKSLYQNDLFNPDVTFEEIIEIWHKKPALLNDYLLTSEGDQSDRHIIFIDQMEQWIVNEQPDHEAINSLIALMDILSLSQRFFIIMAARDEAAGCLKKQMVSQQLKSQIIDFRLVQMGSVNHNDWIKSTMSASGLFFEVNPNRQESLLDLLLYSIERYQCSLTIIQIILNKLYECRKSSCLQYASFHELGGVEGIISQHIEMLFLELETESQQQLVELFPLLVICESYTELKIICNHLKLEDAIDLLGSHLLNLFINFRLLKSEQVGDEVKISFSEINLHQLWLRLSLWIDENLNRLIKISEINYLTHRWLRSGQSDSCLINQAELNQITSLNQINQLIKDHDQQLFLKASSKAVVKNKQIKWLSGMGFFAVLSFCAVIFIYWQRDYNEKQVIENQLWSITDHLSLEINPKLKENGQFSLLESINSEILEIFNSPEITQLSNQSILNYVTALNVMGELKFNQRQVQNARELFGQIEHIIEQNSKVERQDILNQYMLSQYWLGYLSFIESNFDVAQLHWNKYLEVSIKLKEMFPEEPKWELEHSYALNNLGTLSEKTNQYSLAAQYFAESIEIKSNLLEHQPENMVLQADLADSLSWQGNIYRKQGDLKKALAAYEQSLELTQMMNEDNSTKLHRETLALYRMGMVNLDLGALTNAKLLGQSALEKSIQLIRLEPQNNSFKNELINLYLFNASLNRLTADFDQSLSHIQKANELIDYFKLHLKMTAKIAGYQMKVKNEQALIFKHFGQVESAMTAIENGIETWKEHELDQDPVAQITYIMLNLNASLLLSENQANDQRQSNQDQKSYQSYLDNAWQAINQLQRAYPQDRKLMAIKLTVLLKKSGDVSNHELNTPLLQSEYRNPEYYYPLNKNNLITLN